MKEIREWLAGQQDYAQGVALYETHGRSQVVLKSLRFGQTEFTRATLRRELEKLVGEKVVSSLQKVASSPAPVAEKVASSPTPERGSWYDERRYAHLQLELVTTDAERLQLATRILGLSEQITASFRTPAPAEAAQPEPDWSSLTDQGEIRRLLANLRPLRSKLKKRPDRAADLARIEATITLLTNKLS